jgi:hypothetical protein
MRLRSDIIIGARRRLAFLVQELSLDSRNAIQRLRQSLGDDFGRVTLKTIDEVARSALSLREVVSTIDMLLIGASPANGQFRECVAVWSGTHLCSGIAIGPRHVLTSSHCFGADVVCTGDDANTTDASRKFTPSEVATSAKFSIRLLSVDREIPAFVQQVAAGCALNVGTKLTVVGYGVQDTASFGQKGVGVMNVSFANAEPCPPYGCKMKSTSSTVSVCWGDSGGPAFVSTPRGFSVAGVTQNFGQGHCLNPSSFTRIDSGLASWITAVTSGAVQLTSSCP